MTSKGKCSCCIALGSLLGVLSGGCLVASTGDTCEIKTSGIAMKATVEDDGTTVRAAAVFESGDMSGVGTKLEIGECDEFTINDRTTNRREDNLEIEYSVTWDAGDAPTDFVFRLNRKDDGDDVHAEVSLPARFSITAPDDGTEVSRAANLELTWDPPEPGGEIEVELEEEIDGDICFESYDDTVEDTGALTIPPGTIELSGIDEPEDKVCEAALVLTRTAAGAYPSELKDGGSVSAKVIRRVGFSSTQ
jgi:hypothetical protein